ncbi:MAG: N-6 DNA methylase [Phycisphaerales bacterium]
MAKKVDPAIRAHLEWLGFVQPTGLVVSAPALVRAGAILERNDMEGQRLLREAVEERVFDVNREPEQWLPDFETFAKHVLGWGFSAKGYAGTPESPIPEQLEVALPEYHETLRPDFAVRELEPQEGVTPWQLLVCTLEPGEDLDLAKRGKGGLEVSPHGRMERLLRRTGVSAGLLFNGKVLRLVSAPRGESSGWLDFRVADMVQTSGRSICTALRLLLNQRRLLALPKNQRLAALLDDSRKFQNEVSEKLAEQVLQALYEFIRGFQAAHDASRGELLREVLADDPDKVYHALSTGLLRLVFLLYAEEREMLPADDTFLRGYSIGGLYERLRDDAALYPDTMDQRYGAWAQLVALTRMLHDGAKWDGASIPARRGHLFDPDRFPFLEGRNGPRRDGERLEIPLVPDGTIYRALEKLLVLDGERISYRALDVEQIGSVYETMMGFRLETAEGRSIAVKAQKKHGAPTTINLEALLEVVPKDRAKWVKDTADRKLTPNVTKAVKEAGSLDELHLALDPVLDKAATPDLVPPGAMVLQPSDARRRSGSHYTPRSLTEPIVRKTFEPILKRLADEAGEKGENGIMPEQILELKVCDPAMGSGAFLVEACRQLADELVEAWRRHDSMPTIPPDEDELLYARRVIAQRCLYGVDKNPMAADLAKLSIWLATLAKDHAFTFLDHAFRIGDSLVGLSKKQIASFTWDLGGGRQKQIWAQLIEPRIEAALEARREILEAGDFKSPEVKKQKLAVADERLDIVRFIGDLAVAAFFARQKDKERKEKRAEYLQALTTYLGDSSLSGTGVSAGDPTKRPQVQVDSLKVDEMGVTPFHWEIEFPEVFGRSASGFDAFVGNPPFLGGKLIAVRLGDHYNAFLKQTTSGSLGAADLCAYFFRRVFDLLVANGAMGLVATNTIAQADTREVGLDNIGEAGGTIFNAVSRLVWPGTANVHVSVLHILNGPADRYVLNGTEVVGICTRLIPSTQKVLPRPSRIHTNFPTASGGTGLLGIGFVIEPEMYNEWIIASPKHKEVLKPYINGRELNALVDCIPPRYVIDFGERSEREAEAFELAMKRVRSLVKPGRDKLTRQIHEECYWKHWDKRTGLYAAISGLKRVLVCSFVSKHLSFTFLPTGWVYSKELVVIPTGRFCDFASLQSQAHYAWAQHQSGTLKSDLSYSISDALRTYPLPLERIDEISDSGRLVYEHRATLIRSNEQGLTKCYNRFHDPEEAGADIEELRDLHAAMDRAVLDAYGWTDIPTDCEFLLDYEEDDDDGSGKTGRKKKPWRYRWPDEVRDEVLARLLAENAKRAEQERLAGLAPGSKKAGKKTTKKRTKKTKAETETGGLF